MAEVYDACPDCGEEHGRNYDKPIRCDACCGHAQGYEAGHRAGVAEERAAVVAWLHGWCDRIGGAERPWDLGDEIAEGLHRAASPVRCLCGADWVATLPNGACRCWACFVVEIVDFAREDRSTCELRR